MDGWMDGLGWYPGGRGYRAPYGANKNGTKSMHCIIRGKFVISPCRKSALFWIRAVILLFRAEILPCGPPLLPHSCAEPFLGVMQKYSFLGDIYTSAVYYTRDHYPMNLLFLSNI